MIIKRQQEPWAELGLQTQEKRKQAQGGRSSVGVSTEEEQVRAMKRLEERILMLQTYADESGSRPVM